MWRSPIGIGFGYDLQRTGYDPNEASVGVGNVGTLHQLWTASVGSAMMREPVLASGVLVNGVATNVLYAGSSYGATLYAFNADTGALIWKKAVATASYQCGTHTSQFSVGATPAIDRSKNRIYFGDGQNNVYAADLSTGAIASGWPINVANISPDHNFMHGALTYNPANGYLYVVTGSTCDISPWYGRVVALNTNSGGLVGTFYPASAGSTQTTSGGGVWGSGGVSIDPSTNDVYVATGNADTVTNGGSQTAGYSEQIVQLTPDVGTVLAHNYPILPLSPDADFGATPLLFQPPSCPPLLAAVNKSGMFYLYDRASINSGPVQGIQMSTSTSAGDFVGVPAYDPVTNLVYVGLPTTYGIYQPGVAAFSISYPSPFSTRYRRGAPHLARRCGQQQRHAPLGVDRCERRPVCEQLFRRHGVCV